MMASENQQNQQLKSKINNLIWSAVVFSQFLIGANNRADHICIKTIQFFEITTAEKKILLFELEVLPQNRPVWTPPLPKRLIDATYDANSTQILFNPKMMNSKG